MVNPKFFSSRPGLTLIMAKALVALFCCQPPAARADTIQTFYFSGSFTPENGYNPSSTTFSGSLTVNTTTGTLTGADFTFPDLPALDTVDTPSSYSLGSQDLWHVSLLDHTPRPPPITLRI